MDLLLEAILFESSRASKNSRQILGVVESVSQPPSRHWSLFENEGMKNK